MEAKPIWQSKSAWFLVLWAVAYIASKMFGFDEFVPSDEAQDILAAVVVIGGIVLRKVTAQGVKWF